MKKVHHIENIKLINDWLVLTIDRQEHRFPISAISTRLAEASDIERNTFRVMASGYGIHWPLLDEDLSIDGLLGITHTPPKRIKTKTQRLQLA